MEKKFHYITNTGKIKNIQKTVTHIMIAYKLFVINMSRFQMFNPNTAYRKTGYQTSQSISL